MHHGKCTSTLKDSSDSIHSIFESSVDAHCCHALWKSRSDLQLKKEEEDLQKTPCLFEHDYRVTMFTSGDSHDMGHGSGTGSLRGFLLRSEANVESGLFLLSVNVTES